MMPLPGLFFLLARFWRRRSPIERRVILALPLILAAATALALYVSAERRDAASEATHKIETENRKAVRDAIERSKPGPRPDHDEFLECLRNGGAGCL